MKEFTLPEFRQNGFDDKFAALREMDLSMPSRVRDQLCEFISAQNGGNVSGKKILDFGCGRGDLVGALRLKGARAYGIEVEPRFVANGAILDKLFCDEYPILSLVDNRGRSIFPDQYFDYILSDQVFEHVSNLRSVAHEIARLLKPDGQSFHKFPAAHRIIEPHYKLPFVHWLPKSSVRRAAIRGLLAIGFGRKFFPEHSLGERTAIIFKYSVEETYYRSVREIRSILADEGIETDYRGGMRLYLASRLRRWIPVTVPLIDFAATFRFVALLAHKKPT